MVNRDPSVTRATAHTLREPRALLHRAETLAHEIGERIEASIDGAIPRRVMPLGPAIDAERKEMRTHRGQRVSYYQDRSAHGRPLVLLHSINACASAYEMRPLFEHFRGKRPVVALDLPGFGFSERDARPYTPELYAREIVELLARVKDKHDAPDVVALSLTSELAARAAIARRDLVHTLACISPTGLQRKASRGGLALRFAMKSAPVQRTLPLWGPLLFGAVASRPSIRYFLRRSFVGAVPEGLAAYAFASAHQQGGEHAPLAFLTGALFTEDAFALYADVPRPSLALYDRDGYTSFERLPELVERSPMWAPKRIEPTLGMPQFERLDETVAALEEHWREHGRANHVHHA